MEPPVASAGIPAGGRARRVRCRVRSGPSRGLGRRCGSPGPGRRPRPRRQSRCRWRKGVQSCFRRAAPRGRCFRQGPASARNRTGPGPVWAGSLRYANRGRGRRTRPTVRDGARPTAAHGVGDRHPHGGGLAEFEPLEVGDEFFKVLDGHAARRAAPGDAGKVGGMKAKFGDARLHAGGHVAGARRRGPGPAGRESSAGRSSWNSPLRIRAVSGCVRPR